MKALLHKQGDCERLNWRYGRGELQSITWHGGPELIVKIRFQHMEPETRKARIIDSGHVRFRGHTRKIQLAT